MRFQVLFGLKLCHFGSNLFQIIQYCDLRDYDFAKKILKKSLEWMARKRCGKRKF